MTADLRNTSAGFDRVVTTQTGRVEVEALQTRPGEASAQEVMTTGTRELVKAAAGAEAEPVGGVGIVGAGPEALPRADLARSWLGARGQAQRVVAITLPTRFGRALRQRALCNRDGAVGTRTFHSWATGRSSGASDG